MKKNYLFTLLLTFLFSFISYAQVTELYISKYAEGSSNNKFLEIYNGTDAAISLSDYAFPSVANSPTTPGEYEFWNKFPDGAIIAAGDVYVIAHGSADASILAQADHTHNFLSNGDDGYALVKGGTHNDANTDGDIDAGEMTDFTILDWLGDWQADPGSGWDVAGVTNGTQNHTLTRKSSVCGPNNDWASSAGTDANNSEWTVGDIDSGWDTLGSYTGCSSAPSITISSPTSGNIDFASSVDVTLVLSNFNLSADDGSGASDSSGDGYIKRTVEVQGGTAEISNFFSTTVPAIEVVAGSTYTLTVELVDNSGASFDPAISNSVTFTINESCVLSLGSISTTCDAVTAGTDTYSGTIVFTGGNTGISYTITSASGVTIGGDNPNSVAEGTITFSGMTEGMDTDVTIVGGAGSSCDFSRTLYSPICSAFPVLEEFDYTADANLGDQSAWSKLNSGDDMLIATGNLDYTGLKASTGNLIEFDQSGSETLTEFASSTSGTVYASFLLKVTGFQTGTNPDLTDGGYIAALAGGTSSYDARFWVRPNPDTDGTTYDIGFGAESSNPTFTTATYNLQDVVMVVMAYNLDTSLMSLWVNPDASTFEGTTLPTATLSSTDTNPPSSIRLFILRQDSTNETPFIQLDALRISNSWADVTPKSATASVRNNSIEGFALYPNPVTNNNLTITSNSAEVKNVSIFNVLGKNVLSTSVSGNRAEINTALLSSGIYIIKVQEGANTATSKLVIK